MRRHQQAVKWRRFQTSYSNPVSPIGGAPFRAFRTTATTCKGARYKIKAPLVELPGVHQWKERSKQAVKSQKGRGERIVRL